MNTNMFSKVKEKFWFIALVIFLFPAEALALRNPIRYDTFQKLVGAVLNALMQIAVPIAAVAIVWTGLKFVMASGNATKIAEARQQLYNVLIGSAIVLGSAAIMSILQGTLNQLR